MRSVVIISRSLYIKEAVSNTQTEKANWNDSFNSSLYQNLENKKEKKKMWKTHKSLMHYYKLNLPQFESHGQSREWYSQILTSCFLTLPGTGGGGSF